MRIKCPNPECKKSMELCSVNYMCPNCHTMLKGESIPDTINIKLVKDSWTRDEVIELCDKAITAGSFSSTFDFDEWIKSNL